MMNDIELVKIHIALPNHWAIGGESFWAKPLGNSLYRIENVPFYAYGLNYSDVVQALPVIDEGIPEIQKVVSYGGHRTYRVNFYKEVTSEMQVELLESLEKYGANYERSNKVTVAVDVNSKGDHLAVFNQLEKYLAQELLFFETCEERITGSFDEAPEH